MEEKHYILNEIMAFFSKSWTFLFTILTGVVAKLSLDELGGKKRNRRQRIAVVGISIFGGNMAWIYCKSHGLMEQAGWIVAVATLFSETIIRWFVENHKRILFQLLNMFTSKGQNQTVDPSLVDPKPKQEDEEA
jgi:hypothetical protein